ncbi:NB-ARC domain-containing protein [Actinomadura madurae]|uniref:AfsR/SARP family transcriptional regulator n=1 Tax=Actinomadura madurae TaxID=1993 RepID=UPI0020D233A4|nr:BTAD domain-containing putative transcriptional regulator [Actinomadura madurae]MCP9972074.1 NB-ARC domain-containing protein [Actinomadura madurae]
MGAEGVFFRVLGPLAVSVDGDEVAPPSSPVLRGLLGVLVLARGEPLATGRLAELVWTDRVRETSRESVHVGVSRLRKWAASLHTGPSARIEVSYRNGYLLHCPADRSDLGRFLTLADEARSLSAPERRYRALTAAFAERKGPLLAGLSRIDRTDTLVRGLEDQIREAAMALAAAALESGDPEGAVGAVGALIEELPFDEPLHAVLIDLLTASGRPAEALQIYRRLSERLTDDLGVEPSRDVQRAHMRVLSADGTIDEPGTAAAPPGAPPPAQLPPDIPDFAGRTAEVAELVESLVGTAGASRPRAVTVTTISGLGGVGKTTIAVHVAHRVADAFTDGQLYVDLHGDSAKPGRAAELLGRFLRTLGMSGAGIPPSLDERVALYRSRLAGRRILVVLDNAADESQVRPLLPGTPDAAVLVTSRNRLIGLEGARLLNLDVLPSAQAVELITNIVGERRVAAEPDVVAEIARLCGHMPLAVRIAAARLVGRDHWRPSHLADVLREERRRLDELVAGDLEVRAGFEMSYRLLPAPARRAFQLIGLLDVPDFACWTVAALADLPLPAARHHLETLVDAHLVGVAGADETGELRYRLHDLLRLYARELAERDIPEEERASALRRALGGWLALAEEAAERVPGPCYALMHGPVPRFPPPSSERSRLLADPMHWFGAERAALVAAAVQAADLGFTEYAWDLAASLERYCDVRGLYDDWRRMHERVLELCQETGARRGEAVVLRGLLEVLTWTSPVGPGPAMVRMRTMAARVLDLFTELGDAVGTVDAMVAMVWGRVADGEDGEALELAERALRVAREAGYVAGEARALHVTAVVHGEGAPQSALECLEQALVVAEELGNPRFVATIVQFLGAARALCGDIEAGRRLLEESIVMARDLDDRYVEAFSLLYLAKLFVATGDAQARPTLERLLSFSLAGNFRHHLADGLGVLGELNMAEGTFSERSRAWSVRWRCGARADGFRIWRGPCACSATPAMPPGDRDAALAAWAEARELFVRIGDADGRSSVDERLRGARGTARS